MLLLSPNSLTSELLSPPPYEQKTLGGRERMGRETKRDAGRGGRGERKREREKSERFRGREIKMLKDLSSYKQGFYFSKIQETMHPSTSCCTLMS